ncbi:DUF6406 domain-containing protein [Streptomyces sediminimaris]|uniref:DUF6406 domain-containing protein n=1 Tax=Streptomyces sediminimaris TaxID=3383721 RepID=UPI00399A7996
MSERPHVKYPFEFGGRWVLRHHIPYDVRHEGRAHHIVASVFREPSVHGRVQIGCEGRPVAEYDELTPGDLVEITGDTWRVAEVEYRTHVTLERVADGNEEENGAQAGE